jgi:hypothetical protein
VSILTAVSVAVVERWKGYAPLVSALGGEHVFSRTVPPGFVFPDERQRYITVGDKTETSAGAGALGAAGFNATLTAHAWTRGFYDDGPVEEIYLLMHAALIDSPLELDGYGPVALRVELAAVVADPDLEVRHSYVRWRLFTLGQMAA